MSGILSPVGALLCCCHPLVPPPHRGGLLALQLEEDASRRQDLVLSQRTSGCA